MCDGVTTLELHVNSTAQTCTCPQGLLHYPCKHVMKVISMTTGKLGLEIILTLGTWAGSELGRFAQLQSGESLAQLKDDFMCDDAEPEAAQPDSTGTAADNTSWQGGQALSDDKVNELYQALMSSSAAQSCGQSCGTNWSPTYGLQTVLWKG